MNNYNDEPVHYCKTCLSLKILKLEGSALDYCGKCGNTNTSKANIFAWEELFKKKYGKYYLSTKHK